METTASTPAGSKNRFERVGDGLALAGVVAPLLMIGGLKFTPVEIEALKPLISGTPWLAWLYSLFGEAGASYALGIFEIVAALLLLAAPWSARVALVGGALATVTFFVTCTLFFAPVPVWDDRIGGFPALGPLGQFLIKDIALLGISLAITGRCLARIQRAVA
jgi:uncharacterized membrane protein YkgB